MILVLLLQGVLGDPLGLGERGLAWSITATGEVFANVDGGLDEGVRAQGLFDAVLDADLEKLAGWTGATSRVNPMWIEGHGLSRDHTGDLSRVSNIDARDGLRLFEAWAQQALGPASLRAGILAVDQEFCLSDASSLFVNGSFGLPTLFTLNAPFSAYPMGSLGVRARLDLEGLTAMAAVYEGSSDSEARNRSGAEIRLHDDEGVLWLAEIGWESLKLGAFKHSAHAHGVYGVVERSIGGVSLFARAGASPHGPITRYAELGAVWNGAGLAWLRAQLEDASYETVVEATYRWPVLPWLVVQPDVQWIRHPGGFGSVDDATVVGLRVDLLF